MSGRYESPLGVQANAWAAVLTGANTNSPGFLDTFSSPFVSAFGHVSGATTITLMYSHDNTNWYAGPTIVIAGASDFFLNATSAARYACLQSTNNITSTATLAAKG